MTKSNYVNKLNPQEEQETLQLIDANRNAEMLGDFYNPAMANIRTSLPPYKVGKEYFESDGSIYPTTTDEETDTDEEN